MRGAHWRLMLASPMPALDRSGRALLLMACAGHDEPTIEAHNGGEHRLGYRSVAWFYFVHGSLRFPTPEGPAAWRDAPLQTWKGKGTVNVGRALEWIPADALVDESAPPELRAAYFFDVAHDGPVMTIRGMIHRDDEGTVEAVLRVAAGLGAKGEVLLEHAFDPDSGIRLEVANGDVAAHEGDVKMPKHVHEAIDRESESRGRRQRRP